MQPQRIYFGKTTDTPLGPVWVAQSEKGLFTLEFGISRERFEQLVPRFGPVNIVYDPMSVAKTLEQVAAYLAKELNEFELQVDWSHLTDFQAVVLDAVVDIPYGSTATYGEIASKYWQARRSASSGESQCDQSHPHCDSLPPSGRLRWEAARLWWRGRYKNQSLVIRIGKWAVESFLTQNPWI